MANLIKALMARVTRPAKTGELVPVERGVEQATGSRGLAQKYAITSVIAEGLETEGNVISRDSLLVLGVVRGNVTVVGANRSVLLKQQGTITGHVHAPMALIAGEVLGDIEARFVRLYPTARVKGMIRAQQLITDPGALIRNPSLLVGSEADAEPAGDPEVTPAPDSASTQPPAATNVVPLRDSGEPDWALILGNVRSSGARAAVG